MDLQFLLWITILGTCISTVTSLSATNGNNNSVFSYENVPSLHNGSKLKLKWCISGCTYHVDAPEPLLCFPGLYDKSLANQNPSIVQELLDLTLMLQPIPAFLLPKYRRLISVIMNLVNRFVNEESFGSKYYNFVEAALAKEAVTHLRVEINELQYLLHDVTTLNSTNDLDIGVDSSRKLLLLFNETDYFFWKNPQASLPFLRMLYGPLQVMLRVGANLQPLKKNEYSDMMSSMQNLINRYKARALEDRTKSVEWKRTDPFYTVTEVGYKLVDPGGAGWGPCHSTRSDSLTDWNKAQNLMNEWKQSYETSIKQQYDQFFSTPQSSLSKSCSRECPTPTSSSSKVNFVGLIMICSGLVAFAGF